jgi:multimeric flavodoxin WrbA
MKVMAFNGSPRKKWNTALLVQEAAAGVASQGAEVEVTHLYDLKYTGCISCFACKTRNGKSYGRCAVKDDLQPILEKVRQSDGLILGSPIYFGVFSGMMRAFMERLLFPYLTYTDPPGSLFPKKIHTGVIATMGAPEDRAQEFGFSHHVLVNEKSLEMIFGASESLISYDTYQFDDYSKMVADRFDPVKKAKRREEVFPEDLKKAFEMGVRLTRSF